jgi:hypothetical protein
MGSSAVHAGVVTAILTYTGYGVKVTPADPARPNWVRRVPGEATVAGWVEQATSIDKVVTH